MKAKLWVLQLPVIVFFTACFVLSEMGIRGDLDKLPLIDHVAWYSTPKMHDVFERVRSVSTWFTDRKFKARGYEPVRNKVAIVEIDSDALDLYGRWPWHRDTMSLLINNVFNAGAKVVGLDIVFSEEDQRIQPELAELLERDLKRPDLIKKFETDIALENTIFDHMDNLVLGWTTESHCQPLFKTAEECPITDPRIAEGWPAEQEKLAFSSAVFPSSFDPQKTPLISMTSVISNTPKFNKLAEHAGFFNAFPDPDGIIRRTSLVMLGNGKAYPTLPLEMARVGLKDDLKIVIGDDHKVRSIGFKTSGNTLTITPMGAIEYNFRGPSRTFPYIPASSLLPIPVDENGQPIRKPASTEDLAPLKDAYVLIGLTALGVYDMRAFPFDTDTPGVEGHATLLDNILSNDPLIPSSNTHSLQWILAFMILGALLFAYAIQELESVPALLTFAGFILVFGYIDFRLLFANRHINWDTSFLYLEFALLFLVTMAAKYVDEEKNKKFIRSAFSKYVAPAIVDSILEDPTKLSLGGERRELTILFSDIRGFTTFSEAMDAKDLSHFLNDYLGIMTKIVFAHSGTLDKYIGDAVMAFWGAPLAQADHAANACKAASAMMRALAENRPRWKKEYNVDVQIGIGINSGVVSVGNMGSTENFEYTVIGDHVNLASRLEGLTKTYGAGIVTSRFTFDIIKRLGSAIPDHRVLDFVKVKGKKTAVELIQVLERPPSPEAMKLFAEGVELYRAQKWDEASATFRKASPHFAAQPDGSDGPCDVYLERCEEFKKNPPAPGWDGSWEMHSK